MKHRYLENVATLDLDKEKCIGCGRCTEVCPHGVLEMGFLKARVVDHDACMECGACALNCPAKAITVQAGVGCASAIIKSWFTGTEPTCGCSTGGKKGACC